MIKIKTIHDNKKTIDKKTNNIKHYNKKHYTYLI